MHPSWSDVSLVLGDLLVLFSVCTVLGGVSIFFSSQQTLLYTTIIHDFVRRLPFFPEGNVDWSPTGI